MITAATVMLTSMRNSPKLRNCTLFSDRSCRGRSAGRGGVQRLDHHLALGLVGDKQVSAPKDRIHGIDDLVEARGSAALLGELGDGKGVSFLAVFDHHGHFGCEGDFFVSQVCNIFYFFVIKFFFILGFFFPLLLALLSCHASFDLARQYTIRTRKKEKKKKTDGRKREKKKKKKKKKKCWD